MAHCCWVAAVVSDSVRPHRLQPTRLPVPGLLQARILEWVAIPFSRASSQPRDCSLPGSSVPGIFQARVLEWGAIAFSSTDQIHWAICFCGQQLRVFFHLHIIYAVLMLLTSQLTDDRDSIVQRTKSLYYLALSREVWAHLWSREGLGRQDWGWLLFLWLLSL